MSDFQLIKKIYNSFDPFRPLEPGDPAYVDCQAVRGDDNIERGLGREILFAESTDLQEAKTCQLYAGHRGAGKSTELLRLKKYLEDRDCFVVYFSADKEDIDSEDAQYTDILLACTRHLLEHLRETNPDPILNWLRDRGKDLQDLAGTSYKPDSLSGEIAITTFAKITANLRAVPSQRAKIRKLVDPYTPTLIQALNEFIHEAKNQLPLGKTELVIIADSLDRIVPTIQEDGRTSHEHIFIDRSESLKDLNCHLVYTVPISLLYSSRASDMQNNYGDARILPMIKIKNCDNSIYDDGLNKLKEIISRRVKKVDSNLDLETQVFADKDTLERLCLMSGGHVRDLMHLIKGALKQIDALPITTRALQRSITELRDVYRRTVKEEQWELLAEVANNKQIKNNDKYRNLLFNRCLLEYVDFDGEGEMNRWYDVHSLIKDIPEFIKARDQLSSNSNDVSN